jgi:2-polyprenyl-3-methyl-5-hydroxy-6-metoxy-1,4-benzoquinol methylase
LETQDTPALEELSHAWDLLSHDYDKNLDKKVVSAYMRSVSLEYLGKYFSPGMKILELGCGTGDEAIYLAKRGLNVFGTDVSDSMINYAKQKEESQNLSGSSRFGKLPIERISEIKDVFYGAYSSFGGLNCVAAPERFAQDINLLIEPEGYLIVSVMNRFSIAELFLFSLKLKFSIAFRRLGRKPLVVRVTDSPYSFECRYYSPRKFYNYFKNNFELVKIIALPLFLLPIEPLDSFLGKHNRLFKTILSFDKFFGKLPVLRSLGDHFLMVMRKK